MASILRGHAPKMRPMVNELPFIDEFERSIDAAPAAVFLAICRRIGGTFVGPLGQAFTALLGCAYRGSSFTTPPMEGQEVNGFRVARVDAPRALVLEGRHRFASYRLSFFVDPRQGGGSSLRARTDAVFPGVLGAAYRLLVIGSGAHARIVQKMLRIVSAQALSAPRG